MNLEIHRPTSRWGWLPRRPRLCRSCGQDWVCPAVVEAQESLALLVRDLPQEPPNDEWHLGKGRR